MKQISMPADARMVSGQVIMFHLKHLGFAVALAVAVVPVAAAHAGFMSGWDLLEICKANPQQGGYGMHTVQCRSYVVGVADTFDCTETLHGFNWNSAAKISQDDMVKTVITWFNAHPNTLRHEADGLVAAALGEAYPCN